MQRYRDAITYNCDRCGKLTAEVDGYWATPDKGEFLCPDCYAGLAPTIEDADGSKTTGSYLVPEVYSPCSEHKVKVLIACEFSGVARDAFAKVGYDAWSCDLLPSEKSGNHIQDDVRKHLEHGWDLMIAFPPCTYLASSAARWFRGREQEQQEALEFVLLLMNADIPRIAVENPVGVISTHIRKPDQIIQPWMFGHGETKATCLWLKNLPQLKPTIIVGGRIPRVHYESPSPDRWRKRSRTYSGIAEAMAEQWTIVECIQKQGG